jgi:ATP-binding cassette, subfamily F, member 3
VDAVLQGLGFDAVAAHDQKLEHLSGGERGRVGLARQLVVPADVLLLDEPTNHLDLETTQWLEEFLRETPETVMVISHDRAFLDRVADHVLHVEDGTATPYSGGYAAFVRQRAERRLSQQRAYGRQQKAISREEDYIRRNIAGQNTKQAKGRRKRLEWLPRLSPPPDDDATMAVRFPPGERGGDQVLASQDARVTVGDRVLLDDFTGWIRRGDVVGLIGPNGTGKSTLLRAIVGEHPVAAGTLRLGGGIDLAMYRQDFANVPRDRSIYDAIADLRPMWERGAVMGHLGRVQFSGDEVQRVTRSLSGGELARVALAIMMLARANLLIFDEPTNHLDVESIEELEDAIQRFEGTVLLVSHDRELLRKLVTRVWELRDTELRTFDGDFEEWEEHQAMAARRDATADAKRKASAKESAKRSTRDASATQANARDMRRAVVRAEEKVESLEARERELARALSDQAVWEGEKGQARGEAMARELAGVRESLASAIAEWEGAVAAADRIG